MAGTGNLTCKGPEARENMMGRGENLLKRAGEWKVVGMENWTRFSGCWKGTEGF